MYKYFKGEQQNPFDHEKQNARHMFWFYESIFERDFLQGNFTDENWIPPDAADHKEWVIVLKDKPVDKEELFKLWLYHELMVRLPYKYESTDTNEFLALYRENSL